MCVMIHHNENNGDGGNMQVDWSRRCRCRTADIFINSNKRVDLLMGGWVWSVEKRKQ